MGFAGVMPTTVTATRPPRRVDTDRWSGILGYVSARPTHGVQLCGGTRQICFSLTPCSSRRHGGGGVVPMAVCLVVIIRITLAGVQQVFRHDWTRSRRLAACADQDRTSRAP